MLNACSASLVACTVFAMVSLQYYCPKLSNEWLFMPVRRVEGEVSCSKLREHLDDAGEQ